MATALKVKYFSAWFCPFAQRATMALEHHRGVLDYTWIESLGWVENESPSGAENFPAEERDDWVYHWKSPELLKYNPLGMVPTIVDPETERVVTESLLCVEFIDDLALQAGSESPSLFDRNPWNRAEAKLAMDRVNISICSPYYSVLVRKSDAERRSAFDQILRGLERFTEEIEDGSFHGGRRHIGAVDIALLPYAFRLFALEHYRGPDFAIPRSGVVWKKYHAWLDRMVEHASVERTLPDKDRYKAFSISRVRTHLPRSFETHVFFCFLLVLFIRADTFSTSKNTRREKRDRRSAMPSGGVSLRTSTTTRLTARLDRVLLLAIVIRGAKVTTRHMHTPHRRSVGVYIHGP